MKIKQTQGASLINPHDRRRLEEIAFPNLERAKQEVQHLFPNHLVSAEWGRISVVVRDRSFQVAVFQEVSDSLRGRIRP
jgi:hypothetical protein